MRVRCFANHPALRGHEALARGGRRCHPSGSSADRLAAAPNRWSHRLGHGLLRRARGPRRRGGGDSADDVAGPAHAAPGARHEPGGGGVDRPRRRAGLLASGWGRGGRRHPGCAHARRQRLPVRRPRRQALQARLVAQPQEVHGRVHGGGLGVGRGEGLQRLPRPQGIPHLDRGERSVRKCRGQPRPKYERQGGTAHASPHCHHRSHRRSHRLRLGVSGHRRRLGDGASTDPVYQHAPVPSAGHQPSRHGDTGGGGQLDALAPGQRIRADSALHGGGHTRRRLPRRQAFDQPHPDPAARHRLHHHLHPGPTHAAQVDRRFYL